MSNVTLSLNVFSRLEFPFLYVTIEPAFAFIKEYRAKAGLLKLGKKDSFIYETETLNILLNYYLGIPKIIFLISTEEEKAFFMFDNKDDCLAAADFITNLNYIVSDVNNSYGSPHIWGLTLRLQF